MGLPKLRYTHLFPPPLLFLLLLLLPRSLFRRRLLKISNGHERLVINDEGVGGVDGRDEDVGGVAVFRWGFECQETLFFCGFEEGGEGFVG